MSHSTQKTYVFISGKNWKLSLAEITMLPRSYISLDGKSAEQMIRLIEALEEHEDAQNVYTNVDIPDEVMDKVGR